MLKRHHGQQTRDFFQGWRLRECWSVKSCQRRSFVNEWIRVWDVILPGSDYITRLGKCWMMRCPISNVASVICGFQNKSQCVQWIIGITWEQNWSQRHFIQNNGMIIYSGSREINQPIKKWLPLTIRAETVLSGMLQQNLSSVRGENAPMMQKFRNIPPKPQLQLPAKAKSTFWET